MGDKPLEMPPPSKPKYSKSDSHIVIREIKLHMELCSRAWIGLGEGRVLILKDDVNGMITYYDYEEGVFTFHDKKGGSQIVLIEEITEIAGY